MNFLPKSKYFSFVLHGTSFVWTYIFLKCSESYTDKALFNSKLPKSFSCMIMRKTLKLFGNSNLKIL